MSSYPFLYVQGVALPLFYNGKGQNYTFFQRPKINHARRQFLCMGSCYNRQFLCIGSYYVQAVIMYNCWFRFCAFFIVFLKYGQLVCIRVSFFCILLFHYFPWLFEFSCQYQHSFQRVGRDRQDVVSHGSRPCTMT